VRLHGSLRIVVGILDALYGLRLEGLPGLDELFDALVGLVHNGRKPLGVARLPSAVGSDLAMVGSVFVVSGVT